MVNHFSKKSFLDLYFEKKTLFRKIIDIGEWVIIIGIGIILPTPRLNLSFFNYIIGLGLLGGGVWLHKLAHQVNPQAHFPKEKVTKLITEGVYSKIRHPAYTAYLLAYFGAFFILKSFWTLIPIFIFSYVFYDAAKKEEKFLLGKFGKEYEEYVKKVRWRFIPYIF
jgi:protein-S-isoprenylcysteine O-methyltransferase Ste14